MTVGDSLSKIADAAGIVFLGTVVGNGLALLGQILIVRALPPGRFGQLALAFTIVSTVGGFAILGSHQAIARVVPSKEQGDRIGTVQSGFLVAITGGAIAAGLVYGFRFELQAVTDTPRLADLLGIFVLYLLVSPLKQVLIGSLRGFKLPEARALANDFSGPGGAVLLLGAFIIVGKPYYGAIVYWLSMPLFAAIAGVYFLSTEIQLTELIAGKPTRSTVRNFLSFSWPLALSSSSVLLMIQLDVLMVGYFLDPDAVGLYRSIQPLKRVVVFFLDAFAFLYLPIATEYFVQEEYGQLDTLYKTSTKWIVTATFPPTLFCILFAPSIIRVLFSESYVPASFAFAVLVGGVFVRALFGPNGATVLAADNSKAEMYASIAGVGTNFILNLVLIPRIGIVGAALSTGGGFFAYNLVESVALYRMTGILPFSRTAIIPMVPTVAVGFLFALLLRFVPTTILTLAVVGILLACTHVLSLLFTNSLRPLDLRLVEVLEERTTDLTWLKQWLRPWIPDE